ncbi:sialin-like [Acanthaster planci]|uniref:Sialin n=1 Tax=Acanthaster planci TaxID=133434 RepID=A0A8B7ZLL9_ACAPL|nr:sialin-like [Acanthaster planci]XP_022105785.1 sialin-like [Acanthaster planci]XP_022105786.1 sialin-like [Acanthaster planci]XP_022105787.1 sialin-like [Acanthaster planci]XP_022105789.1 sialin-like [Acanthaster planci]XP_022105790.1 sialin-like [Acanthaster planci]
MDTHMTDELSKDQERLADSREPLLNPEHAKTGYGKHKVVPEVPGCISARYALALFSLLGFVNVYAMRVNLSVALVAMVNHTETNHSITACPATNTTAVPKEGEFNWDQYTQSEILASFFYGYIFTQLPGGWLADHYGAKKLFGLGILCTAVFTLVTPVAARAGFQWLIALRILEGLGEGVTFPAMHAMWGHWAPPLERSRLVTISYSGAYLGTVISLPISGVLCNSDILGGWPSVFYLFGTAGVVWFVTWMLFVHDKPSMHPRISKTERDYITRSIGHKQRSSVVPWFSILTSPCVWAVVIAHFCNNWGFYTLLTNLPTYLKVVLGFDISESGFLAAVPYLVFWCIVLGGGQIADFLRMRGILTTTTTRKLFNSTGFILPATFLVITGYVGCNHYLAIVFLTLSVGCCGVAVSGFNVNHLDLAPDYAGLLMGITNMVATIPGFLGPLLVGVITENEETFERWCIIFWIAFGIYIFGTLTFITFGSGKKQAWAMDNNQKVEAGDKENKPSINQSERKEFKGHMLSNKLLQ